MSKNKPQTLSKAQFAQARNFILTNARIIEKRLFHYHFEQGSNEGVFHAVFAYRNSDGGFGHGMEPDTASPESQPLFSIMALEYLDEVGCLSKEFLLQEIMPYFLGITTKQGGIPWMLRPTSEYPCADHFRTVKERAALSTTAPLLGILEKYRIEIPWMQQAEKFVWRELDRIQEKHVFCSLCIPRRLVFLEHTKNKEKKKKALENLEKWILAEGVLCLDKQDAGWGLYEKPHSLCYAPSPASVLRPIFSDDMIHGDLDELIKRQGPDGRWDTWYGISDGMKLEWAGMQTLWTLKVLDNYDRIER